MCKEKLLLAVFFIGAWHVNSFSQDEILFQDPFPLPDMINSDAEEIQPVFDRDSSHLYFVRAFHPENKGYEKMESDQDIWVAEHDEDGQWVSVKNLGELNNEENNGVFGLSTDGSTIYLLNAYLRKRKSLHKGVAIASKKGKSWEHHPHKLPIEDFELHGEHYSFHVNATEDVLILSDVGKNTLGQEDLYVSRKGDDGVWHTPIHLGNKINTAGYEISPFLSPNSDTLYFASDGRPDTHGDADIYYSIRLDDTWQNWTEPMNLGPKVNSNVFDAYFIRSGTDCYFCSNREGNNQIYHTHVYTPPPPPIIFNVIASTNPTVEDGTDGSITVNNLAETFTYDKFVFFKGSDSTVIDNIQTNASGEYTIENLPEGTYDKFRAYFGKYIATSPDMAALKDPVTDPPLPPAPEKFEEIVYFDLNSSYLNRDAKIAIDKAIPKIKKFGDYKIVVEAHTDKRASNNYNKWLSERRLSRVKEYLITKGISSSVISGEYKGEEDPIHDCEDCPEDKHQENRRATIVVTKN